MPTRESHQALRCTSPPSRNGNSPDRREDRAGARRRESLGCRLDLEDPLPQPSIAKDTTLSITEPVIRIEREDGRGRHSNNDTPSIYRITSAFVLRISINDFNDRTQKHNKIFNSVSLRYLYKSGENHSFRPSADRMTSATVTTSAGTETTVGGGISGNSVAALAPSLDLQFVANDSVEVEIQSKSWRRGVSVEDYRHSHCGHLQPAPGLCNFLFNRPPSPPQREVRFARIHPPRRGRGHHAAYHCHPSLWSHDCAVHWHWRRAVDVNAWTPEIYQSTSFPITVTRKVPVPVVEDALARKDTHQLQKWLHFDFKLEVELRELGHRCKDIFSGEPPDVKLKHDFGQLREPEYWAFCINCLPRHVAGKWPDFPTQDRRERYLEISKRKGYLYSRLPDLDGETSDEDERERDKREKDKRGEEEARPRPTDAGCCQGCCMQGSCALHLPVVPCCCQHPPQPCDDPTPRETVTVEINEKSCCGDAYNPHGSHRRDTRITSRTDSSRSPSPPRRTHGRPQSPDCGTGSRPRSVEIITRTRRQESPRPHSPPRHVWFDRDAEEHRSRTKYHSSGSIYTRSGTKRDVDCHRRDSHERREGIVRQYRVRTSSPWRYRGRSLSPTRRSSRRWDSYY